MHWLCKLKGHDFVYEPPIVYCQRCGEFRHNPTSAPAGIKNTDAEIRDGVWSDSTKPPGANIDAAISTRSSHSLADVEGEIQDETGAPSADAQTLYDILANADQGTLTTSGDSIADRIDDYISNAGVDPAIVKRQSKLNGWSKSMQYSAPREVSTAVSGGASATFGDNGVALSPGTTTGDEVYLKGIDFGGVGGISHIITGILYVCVDAPPLTDSIELGHLFTSANMDRGGYLDLTSQVYHAAATTAGATTPAVDDATLLIVDQDFVNSQTVFTQEGGVDETVTIGSVDNTTSGGLVVGESNGAGETIRVYHAYQKFLT